MPRSGSLSSPTAGRDRPTPPSDRRPSLRPADTDARCDDELDEAERSLRWQRRFGEFLLDQGVISEEQLVCSLIAQDEVQLSQLRVLHQCLQLEAERCLHIHRLALDSGRCPFACAYHLGLIELAQLAAARNAWIASRPPLSVVLTQQGAADPTALLEALRDFQERGPGGRADVA